MSNQTVREFLKEYSVSKGWPVESDEDLVETLLDATNHIKTIQHEAHRWYIAAETIVELDGKLIKFDGYVITGDNNVADIGLEYDLDSAKFVERKERQVTEIYYEQSV